MENPTDCKDKVNPVKGKKIIRSIPINLNTGKVVHQRKYNRNTCLSLI